MSLLQVAEEQSVAGHGSQPLQTHRLFALPITSGKVLNSAWGTASAVGGIEALTDAQQPPKPGLSLRGRKKERVHKANRNKRSQGRSLLLVKTKDTIKTQDHRNSIEK